MITFCVTKIPKPLLPFFFVLVTRIVQLYPHWYTYTAADFPFLNEQENVKYLPNVNLGANVVADPNLESTGNSSTLLIFSESPSHFTFSVVGVATC